MSQQGEHTGVNDNQNATGGNSNGANTPQQTTVSLAQQYAMGQVLQPIPPATTQVAQPMGIVAHQLPAQSVNATPANAGMLQPFAQSDWNRNVEGTAFDPSRVYPAKFAGLVPVAKGVYVRESNGSYSLTDNAIVSTVEQLSLVQPEPGPIRDITSSVNARRSTGSREYAFSYPDPSDPEGPAAEFSTTIGLDNCIISYSQNAGRAISRNGPTGAFVSKYLGTYVNLGIPTEIATPLIQYIELCEGRCGVATRMNNDPVKDGRYTWVVCKVVAKENQEFELDYVTMQGGSAISRRLNNSSALMLSSKKSFKGMASLTFRVSYSLAVNNTLAGNGTISPVLMGFQLCEFSDAVKPTNVISTVTVSANRLAEQEVIQAIRGMTISTVDANVATNQPSGFVNVQQPQQQQQTTQQPTVGGSQIAQQMLQG